MKLRTNIIKFIKYLNKMIESSYQNNFKRKSISYTKIQEKKLKKILNFKISQIK